MTSSAFAVAAARFPANHIFCVPGFTTAEDCRAWMAGDRTFFDDLEDWLTEKPEGPLVEDRNDARGLYSVAFQSPDDAVMFKLTWLEGIL